MTEQLKPCNCNNPFYDCDERTGCRVVQKLTRAQTAQAVPPGYVLVPVEPTDAMWNVMMDYGTKKSEWQAILAAAQGGNP